MMRDRHVVVMARRPEHGKVKTRLADALGPDAALSFYASTLRRTLKRLGDDPRWSTVIAATPPSAARHPGRWTRGLPVFAQEEGDLGQRMQGAFDAMPAGPVVIVGSDIPDLSARHVARAFRALERHDAVFGPSDDGGYWLVGIARSLRASEIFGPVRWSTRHALADTLQGLPEGARVATLETLADIDTVDDLRRLRA
ncbi:MAG: TIGR04282 family arsenosugar biosynthesis glycosyltransferase [Alphaproteobacteria bacterium]|mgnify:FL=1|jgi:uncharacterized protein|nr:glycosyltransferase [Rhodospirillaceae bacterium]MDG2483242.1 TIGR04282 family arsenosugar biosynthesis glycosyltransferase [Alphaproteobacteria bacterium]MBT6204873.1 glycosyltransferase [Rhodospirillaceae bacterium]MBT6511993.1 glycosyltransferase [Rhodospirillaceae bacterium]MBT7615171.1 glycosyltransferase [Rhodospirillaceae bacterium]